MSGLLLAQPVLRAIDQNGAPMAGAQLQFYQTGTTTPTPAYSSASLGSALANPVVADAGGLFPPIWLDPSVTYRIQLLTAAGALIQDIDPAAESVVEATQAQVNAGTVTGLYVSPAKLAAWSGVADALGYAPLNRGGDTATNLVLANTTLNIASAGYLGMPVNEQDGAYAFALADSGKMVRGNPGSAIAWTIPPNASVAFPLGIAIVVRNVGAGTITITRGAGVIQWIAGSGTSKDVALASWGMATLIQEAANAWVIAGSGIS